MRGRNVTLSQLRSGERGSNLRRVWDPREFENRLKSRGVSGECPSCHHEGDWIVEPRLVALLLVADSGKLADDALNAVAMVCRNCGFIRLHTARDPVEGW